MIQPFKMLPAIRDFTTNFGQNSNSNPCCSSLNYTSPSSSLFERRRFLSCPSFCLSLLLSLALLRSSPSLSSVAFLSAQRVKLLATSALNLYSTVWSKLRGELCASQKKFYRGVCSGQGFCSVRKLWVPLSLWFSYKNRRALLSSVSRHYW